MEEGPQQSGLISKYNDAVYSVNRLHNHWVLAETYANSGQLKKWKFRLDGIWREISPAIYKMLELKGKKAKKIIDDNIIFRNKVADAKTSEQLYSALDKRHEFLRYVQDMTGKGNVYVEEDDEGFE